MALAQTRSKGRGVVVGDTWGKEEPKLGEGQVRNGVWRPEALDQGVRRPVPLGPARAGSVLPYAPPASAAGGLLDVPGPWLLPSPHVFAPISSLPVRTQVTLDVGPTYFIMTSAKPFTKDSATAISKSACVLRRWGSGPHTFGPALPWPLGRARLLTLVKPHLLSAWQPCCLPPGHAPVSPPPPLCACILSLLTGHRPWESMGCPLAWRSARHGVCKC